MSVLYIASSLRGLESFVFDEIATLEEYKVKFKIALLTDKGKEDPFYPKKHWDVYRLRLGIFILAFFRAVLVNREILISTLKLVYQFNLWREFCAALCISYQVRNDSIKTIYCSFSDKKLNVGYLMKLMLQECAPRLISVVHAHEIYANHNPKFFKYAISKADKVIAISEKNAEILQQNFNLNYEDIIVNKLTIDTDWHTPKNKPTVLFVGRFDARKGVEELLKAAAMLQPEMNFVLVGWGEYQVEKKVAELNLKNAVVFEKLSGLKLKLMYQSADIFCLPSKHTHDSGSEGIPVAIMEAMAYGLPVVTTGNGSIGELSKEYVCDEADVASLVLQLRLAAKDRFINPEVHTANIDVVKKNHGKQRKIEIVKILENIK